MNPIVESGVRTRVKRSQRSDPSRHISLAVKFPFVALYLRRYLVADSHNRTAGILSMLAEFTLAFNQMTCQNFAKLLH